MRKLINEVQINIAKEDTNLPTAKKELLNKFKKVFKDAGLNPIFAEETKNGYWGDSVYSIKEPWFIITSEIGHTTIGWRKRVIEITWPENLIKEPGDIIFKKENVTVGKNLIHAWSYEDATKYLKTLKEIAGV
jgi:hypothetical protein